MCQLGTHDQLFARLLSIYFIYFTSISTAMSKGTSYF